MQHAELESSAQSLVGFAAGAKRRARITISLCQRWLCGDNVKCATWCSPGLDSGSPPRPYSRPAATRVSVDAPGTQNKRPRDSSVRSPATVYNWREQELLLITMLMRASQSASERASDSGEERSHSLGAQAPPPAPAALFVRPNASLPPLQPPLPGPLSRRIQKDVSYEPIDLIPKPLGAPARSDFLPPGCWWPK